jgi:hypothetical protein
MPVGDGCLTSPFSKGSVVVDNVDPQGDPVREARRLLVPALWRGREEWYFLGFQRPAASHFASRGLVALSLEEKMFRSSHELHVPSIHLLITAWYGITH